MSRVEGLLKIGLQEMGVSLSKTSLGKLVTATRDEESLIPIVLIVALNRVNGNNTDAHNTQIVDEMARDNKGLAHQLAIDISYMMSRYTYLTALARAAGNHLSVLKLDNYQFLTSQRGEHPYYNVKKMTLSLTDPVVELLNLEGESPDNALVFTPNFVSEAKTFI